MLAAGRGSEGHRSFLLRVQSRDQQDEQHLGVYYKCLLLNLTLTFQKGLSFNKTKLEKFGLASGADGKIPGFLQSSREPVTG